MKNTVTVIDGEWTITERTHFSDTSLKEEVIVDGSAYNPANKLVMLSYCSNNPEIGKGVVTFNHTEFNKDNKPGDIIQDILDKTDLLVNHNIRADLEWMYECGFKYEGKIFDTMIYAYMRSKGFKKLNQLSLFEVAKDYGIHMENKDILSNYFAEGYNTDSIPYEELYKYALSDAENTYALYQKQLKEIKSNPEVKEQLPILKVTNEFAKLLVDMRRSGFYVDHTALEKLEKEYRHNFISYKKELEEMLPDLMGHKPYNLNSPDDRSKIVFGYEIVDKKAWAEYFNIGAEKEGVRKGKPKFKIKRSASDIKWALSKYAKPIYKTTASQCNSCKGTGKVKKYKKDGELYKRLPNCKDCEATGIIYTSTGERAGLGVDPLDNFEWTAAGGFKVGGNLITKKGNIHEILESNQKLGSNAKKFLEVYSKYSGTKVYLTNFIEGIKKNIHGDIMHLDYTQCNTATGRLSSPFHNLPRGDTFPIKKCIVSRFKEGKIISGDFKQLEFRVAALLSQDPIAMYDIENEVDVHSVTAEKLTEYGQETGRQAAKNDTFKPLFGGLTGTEAQKKYYEYFLNKYSNIRDWQNSLVEEAVTTKQIKSPSGKIYYYPYARYNKYGNVISYTKICNYPIQGFSFDVVMLVMLEIRRLLNKHNCKSKIILTVHDSVVIDTHPDEIKLVLSILKTAILKVPKLVESTYNIEECNVELGFDVAIGDNGYDQDEIDIF